MLRVLGVPGVASVDVSWVDHTFRLQFPGPRIAAVLSPEVISVGTSVAPPPRIGADFHDDEHPLHIKITQYVVVAMNVFAIKGSFVITMRLRLIICSLPVCIDSVYNSCEV